MRAWTRSQCTEAHPGLAAAGARRPSCGWRRACVTGPSRARRTTACAMLRRCCCSIRTTGSGTSRSRCGAPRCAITPARCRCRAGGSTRANRSKRPRCARRSEEIGVVPADVDVLGSLTPLPIAVSGHLLHPVVGVTATRPAFALAEHEVEALFEVPLTQLQQRRGGAVGGPAARPSALRRDGRPVFRRRRCPRLGRHRDGAGRVSRRARGGRPRI